jgi:hypothetical protein
MDGYRARYGLDKPRGLRRLTLWRLTVLVAAGVIWPGAAWAAQSPSVVEPRLECVRRDVDGSLTAVFGYRSTHDAPVNIPAGVANAILPGPPDAGQPEIFVPGRSAAEFELALRRRSVVWSILGSDGRLRSVIASGRSRPCPQEVGVAEVDSPAVLAVGAALAFAIYLFARSRARVTPG